MTSQDSGESPQEGYKRKPLSDRKSILDSLVKRRRESISRSKHLDAPIESSEEDTENFSADEQSSEEDSFVVSDGMNSSNTSSSSSESDDSSSDSSSASSFDEVGFYARVSSMIDKKNEKLKTIADTMSPRQAFFLCMQYYAMCLVSRNCEYPKHSENKKLQKILPELKVAVRRIERELMSRRDNIRPSYWNDESVLVRTIQRYPQLDLIDHRKYFQHKYDGEPCAACHRMGWSWELRFRGDQYDSKELWLGNIKGWLMSMDLFRIGKAKLVDSSSSSEDDDGEDVELVDFVSRRIEVGTQCAKNIEIYHALQHSKNFFFRKIYDYIVNQKLDDSLTSVVRAFKDPNNVFVNQLYEQYNDLIALSESRFETDDHNESVGPSQNIKLDTRKKMRHSNRF